MGTDVHFFSIYFSFTNLQKHVEMFASAASPLSFCSETEPCVESIASPPVTLLLHGVAGHDNDCIIFVLRAQRGSANTQAHNGGTGVTLTKILRFRLLRV